MINPWWLSIASATSVKSSRSWPRKTGRLQKRPGSIEVDYEELPAVFDLIEAAKPGAPVLYAQCNETNAGVHREEFNFELGGNVCSAFSRRGREHRKRVSGSGRDLREYLHLATGAAWPYRAACRHCLLGAERQAGGSFRLAKSLRRARAAGADFQIAGKSGARDRPPPAAATAVKPTRLAPLWPRLRQSPLPRAFGLKPGRRFFTGRRYGAVVKIKTGAKRDGAIVERKVEGFYQIGAYALDGPVDAKTGCYVSSGPCNIPNRSLSTYSVYTDLPPTGPFRGVGVSHVCWAYESETDDIARRFGIDPLELRLKHLVKEGDEFVTGEKLVSVGITDCSQRTAAAIGWKGKEEQ